MPAKKYIVDLTEERQTLEQLPREKPQFTKSIMLAFY